MKPGPAVPTLPEEIPASALPAEALSVRQPWAWAIIFGGKTIENRTAGAIRAGKMREGQIALHAARGMTEREYRWGAWKLAQIGVTCPLPADLPRGAIIGAVTVTGIITESDSPWFGGPCGLELAEPRTCRPIPAKGALGYFAWAPGGNAAAPAPWMRRYGAASLFETLPLGFETPPEKPFPNG